MKALGRTISVVALLTVFGSALACSIPKPGGSWTADDLIKKSRTIILAVLIRKETDYNPESGRSLWTTYHLIPIEVLKGDPPEVIAFDSHSEQHYNRNFSDHTDADFWTDDVGRSEWPCCICGPDHTFVGGETYLLFPDAFGAMKSAEIVNRPDDKWLVYVRESLNDNDE